MTKLLRLLIIAAVLAPALAIGQSTPSQQVSQLAPQLIAFAGSQTNFDSLVNGLALGSPVTLVTVLPTGQVQTVTFTPQGTMTATQIAQTLETARQSLISRGVGAPSGQQVAIALTGGVLPTQTGTAQVGAMLPAANLPATSAAAGASAAGTSSAVTTTTTPAPSNNGAPSPAAILQGQNGSGTTPPSPAQVIQNNRGPNVSDTPTPGNISNTPTVPNSTAGSTAGSTAAPAAAPSGSAPSGR